MTSRQIVRLLLLMCERLGLEVLGQTYDRVLIGRSRYFEVELIIERTGSKSYRRPAVVITPRFLPENRIDLTFSDVLGFVEVIPESQFVEKACVEIQQSDLFLQLQTYCPAYFLQRQKHLVRYPTVGTVSTVFCNGISMALGGEFALARRVLASSYDRSLKGRTMRNVAVYAREALNCVEDRARLNELIEQIAAEFPNRR